MVAALDGDWAAARDVQLDLPQTGVCSSDLVHGETSDAGCCGSTSASQVQQPAVGAKTGLSALSLVDVSSGRSCCA